MANLQDGFLSGCAWPSILPEGRLLKGLEPEVSGSKHRPQKTVRQPHPGTSNHGERDGEQQ